MYMSPEQVMDAKHLDYKTDLYSLAVTFVQLLTGQKPYDMDSISDYQVRKCIVEEPLRIDMLPHIWLQLLAPYLAKNPADRPALVELDPSDDAEDTVSGASASRPSPISDENTICG
jgi:serine/threonine-protein kinase